MYTTTWHESRQIIPKGSPLSKFVSYQPAALWRGRELIDCFYPLQSWGVDSHEIFCGEEERRLCDKFYRAAEDRTHHYQRLDEELSRFLFLGLKMNGAEDAIVNKCVDVLGRMPRAPPPFTGAQRFWSTYSEELREYYPSIGRQTSDIGIWEHLYVVSQPSKNTLRTLLNFCSPDGDFWDPFAEEI
jgi:hypothetical protein